MANKIKNIVKNTIEKYKMIENNDRILVALSGGKDSITLLHILTKLGYEPEAVFINLRIPEFSEKSKQIVETITEETNTKFHIIDVEDYGIKIEKVPPRPVCSVCGIVKRYLINRFSVENGFSIVLTGHTMEDELVFFLNNLVSGNFEYIAKQKPVLERSEKVSKKGRPLFFVSESEIEKYVKENNLPVLTEKCPNSKGNKQERFKEMLKNLHPETKRNMMKNVLKISEKFSVRKEWNYCKLCGYPTESKDGICSFCKIKNYFESKK